MQRMQHYMRHPEDIAVKLVKVLNYINGTWPYYQHGRKGSHVVLHTDVEEHTATGLFFMHLKPCTHHHGALAQMC
eukprot:1153699-Pelagomonas_calceolata.AAC.4